MNEYFNNNFFLKSFLFNTEDPQDKNSANDRSSSQSLHLINYCIDRIKEYHENEYGYRPSNFFFILCIFYNLRSQ